MPTTIYGIKNCETMKKARAWLDKRGVDYVFHDYKTAGIERERVEGWCRKVGWETLLNRAGTTLAKDPAVHAITDVTGFGLLGHGLELLGQMRARQFDDLGWRFRR